MFNQLDHALTLHLMLSPKEASHSSAVVRGTGRAAPLQHGAFAQIGRCDGCVPVETSAMPYISPQMRMMAFACPASHARFASSNWGRCVRRRFWPISPHHIVN